jgi:GTP pyrophosphokinase
MKKVFEKRFEELYYTVSQYISDGKLEILKKAFWFGYEAHKQQYRRSGDPYFEHSVQVATILSELRMDVTTIAAGLLHDVVEDTGVTLQELSQEFGNDIADLVDGVTKIPDMRFTSEGTAAQAENFRKMVLSMAKDIRVVLIKFADRLHNMRTLEFLPEKKQKSIAQETLDVYAPLAHRFGIAVLGEQFEDLSLKFIDPKMYRFIEKKFTDTYQDRIANIEQMEKPILEEMEKLHIPCRIMGKQKNFYNIYQEMKENNVTFDEVFDTVAMRIITQKKEDCYSAVGVVHSLFTPVADRFKDYIASSKSSGYQSLHTTVISSNGRMVEVLIRTEAMDYIADMGIAAHWMYNEKLSDKQFDDQLGWIRQFLDFNKENSDATEFMAG